MIDDDDKLRRNVVVFSAVVLAVTFLDLPIGSISAKFLGAEHAAVSVFKVWLMALLVLFYLVIRFSFPETPSDVKPIADWKRDYSQRRDERRHALAEAFLSKRKQALQNEVVQTYEFTDEPHLPARLGPKMCIGQAYFVPSFWMEWETLTSCRLVYWFSDGDGKNRREIRDHFTIPAVVALFIPFRAAALSTFYSNTAANWLFPRALAVMATLCISVKLVHTW